MMKVCLKGFYSCSMIGTITNLILKEQDMQNKYEPSSLNLSTIKPFDYSAYKSNFNSNSVTQPSTVGQSAFLSNASNLFDSQNAAGAGLDAGKRVAALGASGGETPWYQDSGKLQGYTGLASSFAQLASLPGQLKLAKLQREGLQQNINQAKVDNAFRANVRSNLGSHRTGGT